MSDLWKFDVVIKQWTWMKGSCFSAQTSNTVGRCVYGLQGVSSVSNTPGNRTDCCTWTDAAGDLWLFGGTGGDSVINNTGGPKNDIWKYNIASNSWTWMKGSKLFGIITGTYGTQGIMAPSNNPGARSANAYWRDASGDFWLFGGAGYGTSAAANGVLNDIWKYSVSANQWVWIKGSSGINSPGSYGTIGVSVAANNPSARGSSFFWNDKNGNFWIYGGYGYDGASNYGSLNDLWKYNPTSNQWVWMKGTNIKNQVPVYGTMNVPTITTRPGSMGSGGCWADSTGNLWLSNSFGTNSVATDFYVNIMWKYNVTTNQWTWVKGPNILANQPGNFGTMNISAASNIPGGRNSPSFWTRNGEFWLFGGFGFGSSPSSYALLNDLWRFIPCYTATTLATNTTPVSNNTICSGSTTNLSATGIGPITWYDINSNSLTTGTLFITPTLTTTTTFLFGDNASCILSSITITVAASPTLNITASNSVICNGSNSTLTAISAGSSYLWSTGATTSTIAVNPTVTSAFNVTVTTVLNGCKNTGIKTITVNPTPTVTATSNSVVTCPGKNVILTALGANTYTWNTGPTTNTLLITPNITTTYTVTGKNSTNCTSNFIIIQSVNPSPTLAITVSNSAICFGDSTILNVNSASASYTWNTNTNSQTISVTPTLTTVYNVTITNLSTGCTNFTSKTITVNTLPSVNASSSMSLSCAGQTVTLTANGANTYTWSTNTVSSFINVNPFITNNYTVTGQDLNGCNAAYILTQNVTICTGINSFLNKNLETNIYPNPSSGNFIIEQLLEIEAYVYNSTGKHITTILLKAGKTTLSLNEYSKGVYYIRFGNTACKLIRE
jgi:hypothetical protein